MRLRFRLRSGRVRLLVAALPVVLAATALGAVYFHSVDGPGAGEVALAPAPAAAELPPVPALLVHVSGAVQHPGLYRLNRGERVYAAIAAAGGITAEADPDRLPDLAGRLRDGQQVKVPARKGTGARSSNPKVDLNQAGADELATVPGISPDLASAVVAYRERFGSFSTKRELVTLLGMAASDYSRAQSHLRV